jgi:HK97 family phage portal protein
MSSSRRKPSPFTGLVWRVGAAIRALSGGGTALPPWDDYWYQRTGFDSSSGMNVSPETAMRLSAVFSCIRVRSESLAMCPLIIYRHLPNGGRERAPNHPLYKVLHDTPNQWQTAIEFIEMMQGHLDLRGNAFARILPGPRGAIDQLVPLHPDLVQVYRLPTGGLKYSVRSRYSGELDWYAQDEIFHLRGMSSDGLVGMSPIAANRETVGTALAIDDYAGRFFMNSARPNGVLEYPGKFKDDSARQKFGESWRQAQTAENQHKVAVLEDGMKYTSIGITNVEAEFLNSKKLTREEIAGIYRVPPHKIAILERSTNNNIEHQGIEFVTDCMRPVAVRWEQRINADLIEPLELADGNEYFAEFIVDGLLRGDMKSRYDAYQIGRNGGWLCPNDVCNFENLNPIPPEKGGNDYLRPLNYVVAGSEAATGTPAVSETIPGDNPAPDTPDDSGGGAKLRSPAIEAAEALLRELAESSARHTVSKEVFALRKAQSRNGADSAAFFAEVDSFYQTYSALVARRMCISPASAAAYIAANRKLLSDVMDPGDRSAVIDFIDDVAPGSLADLKIGSRQEREKASVAV